MMSILNKHQTKKTNKKTNKKSNKQKQKEKEKDTKGLIFNYCKKYLRNICFYKN